MEPRKHTLAELFEGQLIYVVPSYQRLYVWNRDDQWDPLWSDVEEMATVLFDDALRRGAEGVEQAVVEAHFLGAVVLKMSGSTPDLSRQLRVIDGQQRLTTLQLLLAAAVNELELSGLSAPADRLRELTSNSSRSASYGNDSFKINHHRREVGHDYERFRDVMNSALNGSASDNIGGPMADCLQFFQGAIHSWLSAKQDYANVAASALATTLIMKLSLVGIYLDPHEKEHIIFETLNARGEPLTEWDKIKNYLLYKADEEQGLDQEAFYEDYLDEFDRPWWRELVGRGAQRPRIDVFADYWLESRKVTPVAVRRVFREFQRHVDDLGGPLEAMMQGFIRDAKYFERYESSDAGDRTRERIFHNRRLNMAVGAFWPLLLRLQRIEAQQSVRDRWFAALESYFVRRLITGYQARSYDQIALELLETLPAEDADGSSIGDSILDRLLQYRESASIWPSDAEVRQAVLNRHLPQYAQRLVLSAIEQYLITDRAAVQFLSPGVQIEHIMPRGWQSVSWPLPKGVEQALAESRREEAIATLGNLTLLNGPLNLSISNAAWDVKRSGIEESDNLFLNRRLLQEFPNAWTEDDIHSRGEWMHNVIVEIWPRG